MSCVFPWHKLWHVPWLEKLIYMEKSVINMDMTKHTQKKETN